MTGGLSLTHSPATTQRSLFEDADTLQARFEAFDQHNPQVYRLFKHFAYEMKTKRAHYGAKSIMERIRWHTALETTGEPFKINNDWASRYARKLIADDASFADFFETRTLKA